MTGTSGSSSKLSAEAAVVARGSLVNLAAMVTGAALAFALTVLVSRWLQPSGAGAFFELVALFTILSNTFELGADTGLVRWISRARAVGGLADVRRTLVIALVPVLIIGTAAGAAMWLAAPELARLFLHGLSPHTGATDVRIVAPLVPLGSLSACILDGARGFGRMWPYLIIEGLGKPVARIAAVLAALVAGWGMRGAVLGWGLPVIVGLAGAALILTGVVRTEVPTRARALARRQRGAEPPRPPSQPESTPPPARSRPESTPPPARSRLESTSPPARPRFEVPPPRRPRPVPPTRSPSAATPPPAAPGPSRPSPRPRRDAGRLSAAGTAPPRPPRAEFSVTPELAATLELPIVIDAPVPAEIPARRPPAGPGRHRGAPRLVAARWRQLSREFWGFAALRGFQGTFQVVILWLDILLVGAIVSRYAAGVYGAVSKLALVGTFALEGNRLAIAPQLSALLARREHDRAADLYQSATRWLMLASWPLYIVLAVFPAVVLGIFGARYSVGATALVVLCVAMLVNLGTGNVTVVLLMGGKSSWSAINAAAALGVNIGLNLVLLPRIGITGAAIAWGASIVVDNVAAMIEIRWVLGLAPFGPGYGLVAALTLGCFGVTGAAARLLLGQTLIALVAGLAVSLAAFGFALYLARAPLQLTGMTAALRLRAVPATTSRAGQQAA